MTFRSICFVAPPAFCDVRKRSVLDETAGSRRAARAPLVAAVELDPRIRRGSSQAASARRGSWRPRSFLRRDAADDLKRPSRGRLIVSAENPLQYRNFDLELLRLYDFPHRSGRFLSGFDGADPLGLGPRFGGHGMAARTSRMRFPGHAFSSDVTHLYESRYSPPTARGRGWTGHRAIQRACCLQTLDRAAMPCHCPGRAASGSIEAPSWTQTAVPKRGVHCASPWRWRATLHGRERRPPIGAIIPCYMLHAPTRLRALGPSFAVGPIRKALSLWESNPSHVDPFQQVPTAGDTQPTPGGGRRPSGRVFIITSVLCPTRRRGRVRRGKVALRTCLPLIHTGPPLYLSAHQPTYT